MATLPGYKFSLKINSRLIIVTPGYYEPPFIYSTCLSMYQRDLNFLQKTLKMKKSVCNMRKSIYVLTIIPREEEEV